MLELSSVCVFENVLPNASIPHGDPGWLRYICGCTLRYFVNSSESTLLSPTYSASNIVSGLVFSADDGAFTAEELASINSPIAQTMAHGMSKPAANDIEGVRQALTVFAARYPACRAVATNLTRGRSIHLSFS